MANMIVISGYLAADPEIRTTQSGVAVASLRLAVRRKFAKDRDTSDFFNVEAWRGNAEFAGKYFYKGKPVEIEGHLETRPWTDKNGSKHEGVRIVAERLNFSLGDKPKEEQQAAAGPAPDVPAAEEFDPFAGDVPEDLNW